MFSQAVKNIFGSVGSCVLFQKTVAPYKVTFVPNGSIGWDPHTKEDLRVHLDRIPEGTVLYTVSARRTKTSTMNYLGSWSCRVNLWRRRMVMRCFSSNMLANAGIRRKALSHLPRALDFIFAVFLLKFHHAVVFK